MDLGHHRRGGVSIKTVIPPQSDGGRGSDPSKQPAGTRLSVISENQRRDCFASLAMTKKMMKERIRNDRS